MDISAQKIYYQIIKAHLDKINFHDISVIQRTLKLKLIGTRENNLKSVWHTVYSFFKCNILKFFNLFLTINFKYFFFYRICDFVSSHIFTLPPIFTISSTNFSHVCILNYSSNPTSIVIGREIATSRREDARQMRRAADRTWSVPGGRRCRRKVSTGTSPDYEGDISWLPAPAVDRSVI